MQSPAEARRTGFVNRLVWLAAVASIPSALALLALMVYAKVSVYLTALVGLLLLAVIGYCLTMIKTRLAYQFMSLSNLLEAMATGDYSLRGRRQKGVDPLGELVVQINALADILSAQRFAAEESRLLLGKVINQINVAIFALDADDRVSLANPAAIALYGVPEQTLLGSSIGSLAAEDLMSAASDSVVEFKFPKRCGRFHIFHDQFREHGSVHRLIFVTDVRVLLRAEERRAWQDLIRVISHEINNSLAPINSISRTLQKTVLSQGAGPAVNADLIEGLQVVEDRSGSLKSFIKNFGRLSKLSPPAKQSVAISKLIQGVIPLFDHRRINCVKSSEVMIEADPVQMEQVLINLLKNADEAMSDSQGSIGISWTVNAGQLEIRITDEGCGIANPANLFVPFYTTKDQGSGVGLALCRQIIEAHGGFLSLANRDDAVGCVATIELPARILHQSR